MAFNRAKTFITLNFSDLLKIYSKISLLLVSWVGILLLSVHLTSCAYHRVAYGSCSGRIKTGECWRELVQDVDIIHSSYTAADKLLENLNIVDLDALMTLRKNTRFWVTTIANIDHLEESTSLGRLIGEQLSARLAQQGYTVIDVKLQKELTLIPYQGEFILSRYLLETGQAHQVNAVVAGTYAVGKDLIYVTLKLFDLHSQRVISSFAYTLPLGPNTDALLQEHSWWYSN